ncbi:MAG: AbrB/MazE/SpoVT family DNA-binding domain-containing protein [Spirochaetes bacterium]|nr:AbrB/MazE/SpoVT family DNA-binding domain-containing protein [Spirochaetota bacterium]
MKLNVVPIGNSKGIRLPKDILNQCRIENEVDLEIEDGKLIITPVKLRSRKNWDSKFKEMKKNNDDKLIIDDNIDLDMENWEW